jgi:transcription antitermination factor NusA-like protein
MKVDYLGGIRYDIAEMQLRAPDGNNKHYLRVRASGTEPINRIYVESSHPELGKQIMRDTLNVLEDKSIEQVTLAYSPWRLVDILVQTKISPKLIDAVEATIKKSGWDKTIIISNLSRSLPELENRNRKVAQAWLAALK